MLLDVPVVGHGIAVGRAIGADDRCPGPVGRGAGTRRQAVEKRAQRGRRRGGQTGRGGSESQYGGGELGLRSGPVVIKVREEHIRHRVTVHCVLSDRERPPLGRTRDVPHGRQDLVHGLPQALRRPCPISQRGVERRRGRAEQPGPVGLGIHRRVEHEPIGSRAEHLEIHRAEVRPIRGADVGDLPLAERLADEVHVPCGVAGRRRPQQHGVVTRTTACQFFREGHTFAETLQVGPGRPRERVGLPVAPQRRTAPDEPRIHADEVVPRGDLRHERPRQDQFPRRPARPSRVEQHHAAAARGIGGLHPGQRDRDPAPARMAVVDRHGDVGALRARFVQLHADAVAGPGRATVPGDRLGRGGGRRGQRGGDQ
ncbi:Hypothetical protein AJAP_13030 [Amycolatopsis japonica]|uniref:Uncharacterized protein n=1 Tax=Amycolatopsis japonica TaxID=208439 RepID=A0A075UMT2_9PSEU|nr:Hypothetical protein AJAP_13030 [Amycolatopsis japonica]